MSTEKKEYVNWEVIPKTKDGDEPKFKTTSKDPQEGYVEHTWVDPDSGKKKTNYWKLSNSIKGRVQFISMKDDKFKGQCLMFVIKDGEDNHSVKIPMVGINKDNVTYANGFFKKAAKYVSNLSYDQEVELIVERNYWEEQNKYYKNIYFKDVQGSFTNKDIPPKVEEKKFGKTVENCDDMIQWLYDRTEEGIKAFLSTKPQSNSSTQEPYQKPEPQEENQVVGDEDDLNLPF